MPSPTTPARTTWRFSKSAALRAYAVVSTIIFGLAILVAVYLFGWYVGDDRCVDLESFYNSHPQPGAVP